METIEKQIENSNAFPLAIPADCVTEPGQGMTLRDYFAAKAMQGMITLYGKPVKHETEWGSTDQFEDYSKASYKMADAMLKERQK